jgi:hypothetical protein
MLSDIAETLMKLKEFNIKLNPGKCALGVEEGKFLGVMVTKEGLRAIPEKVKAIAGISSPKSMKEVQMLSGRLVELNIFLAKHAKNHYLFITNLKACLNEDQFR